MSSRSVPHVLALDFDGVVCDSLAECFATSYLAYRQLNADLRSESPGSWQSLFNARRGVVRPSGHYLLLWDWITRFPFRDLTPMQFEDLGRGQEDRVQEFERLFHLLRDAAIRDDPKGFIELNPPYPLLS